MKTLLVAFIALGLLTSHALGQGGGGRRGGGRGGPGSSPGRATTPAPTAPKTLPITPTAAQQLKTKLKADLAAVRAKGQVTPELKKEFVTDLMAAARGTTKPSPASVERLADDLLGAIAVKAVPASNDAKTALATNAVMTALATNAEKTVSVTSDANPVLAANDTKIVDNLVIAVNSVGLSAARKQEIVNDLQSALTAEGVVLDTAAIICEDLKTLAAEVQETASK